MFSKTDVKEKLYMRRNKRISVDSILQEVHAILANNELERNQISSQLVEGSVGFENNFTINKLIPRRIFHLDDIKNICVTYRLRFLDSQYFKGDFPEEAISKIRQLEKEHKTSLSGFKVIAPSKRLKLENADDPLLFTPMGNDYFYLIHKWGNDLHPLRKWLMWPYKSFDNLVFTIFLISVALTAITPLHLFTKGEVTPQEWLLMFLFMFKAVGGIALFYGFAKGKNFNTAIWNSKYYNA